MDSTTSQTWAAEDVTKRLFDLVENLRIELKEKD
jgi:hypothetical protein